MKNTNHALRVLISVIPYIVILGAFSFFGSYLIPDDSDSDYAAGTFKIFTLVGTFVFVFLMQKLFKDYPFEVIGLWNRRVGKDLVVGVFIGVGLIWIGFLSLCYMKHIGFQYNSDISYTELLYCVVLYAVVAVEEEVLMRGWVQRNFMLGVKPWPGLLLASLLFSGMHFFNPNSNFIGFFNIFLAGGLLGVPYLFRGTLWISIGIHFGWNLMQSLLGFNVSGTNTFSLIDVKYITNDILVTGGAFGFEGSALCSILTISAIVFMIFFIRKKDMTAFSD